MRYVALGVEKSPALLGSITAIVLLRLAPLRLGLRTPRSD
jgi:hypothetical protein